jgi:site-specific DNA-cytosine methylase
MPMNTHAREVTHFHFCCGIGGGAKGFNKANPRVGTLQAKYRCLGCIDVDASAIRDFDRIVGVPGTVMDLFTREQYIAFHGKEPPAGWREMALADIRRAAGNERPNIVFISSPCKGASGLLSEKTSQTPKYQALNELTLRCIWLMAEDWADDPVDLIVFENVPRLATRGWHLLDQINQVPVAETTHD